MVEFKQSVFSGFKYNELTPHISWGNQFVQWTGIDKSPDEEVRNFAAKLKNTIIRQKAIELVRSHVVPG